MISSMKRLVQKKKKKVLPQYEDAVADEGVTPIDISGRFTAEAEKKLQELRKRLQGVEDVNNVG